MMKLGFSKGWPTALEAITGSKTMSISSLKNYLQPLLDYMANELDENGEVPGFGGLHAQILNLKNYWIEYLFDCSFINLKTPVRTWQKST